jgi:nucleoid-associated protein YgaU
MSTMTVSRVSMGMPAVRLTRRGRLLLTALVLLTLVAAAVLLSGGVPALAGTDPAPAVVGERVTVRPGETLWQIAERVAPGSDPRETVARILDLNGLQTAEVQAGTALQLP